MSYIGPANEEVTGLLGSGEKRRVVVEKEREWVEGLKRQWMLNLPKVFYAKTVVGREGKSS